MELPPKIMELQALMRRLPQVELGTWHYFCDGMYARAIACPAGSVVVGKIHKREHFLCITKGKLRIVMDTGTEDYEAGSIVIAHAGSKRAILGLEDSILMTVHRTDKTALDEIEEELIIPEEAALFDARNKLKELT